MDSSSQFLDIQSFTSEVSESSQESHDLLAPPASPFLSLYESEEAEGQTNPEAEEYTAFLNELEDEEMNESLFELATEAAELFETQVLQEGEFSQYSRNESERVLEQYFQPLATESEGMLEALEKQFGLESLTTLSENDFESFVNEYRPQIPISPSFENFFGKLKKLVKKVAKGAVNLAKKGISFVGNKILGPVLGKLKLLIKPLLKRVLQFALGKLPASLQPLARKLATRLPFLKETEESEESGEFEQENMVDRDVSEIQHEFNRQVANLLFAPGPVEQELETAQILNESQAPANESLVDLNAARAELEEALINLKDGENPAPHIERFVPAILAALRIGIRIIGRQRVVNFLAGLLSKLIGKFVGPEFASPLSKAIVNAGMGLMSLEAAAELEKHAASSAVVASLEDTVRQVATLPEYILENEQLLEAYTMEAFERAVTANMPQVLPRKVYLRRPDLRESITLRGTWILMPMRGHCKRYKKYTQVIRTKLSPHKTARVLTFGGVPLSEFLEEQEGLAPGEEVEAEVHLYEAIPETLLPQIAQLENDVPGLGTTEAYSQLHPLTPEAAEALLGEPGLGRPANLRIMSGPYASKAGQRYYYLRIPSKSRYRNVLSPVSTAVLKSPAMVSAVSSGSSVFPNNQPVPPSSIIKEPASGIPPAYRRTGNVIYRRPRGTRRHSTRVKVLLDFRNDQIRLYLYLSEIRSQEIAVRLRQRTHAGMIAAFTGKLLDNGVRTALWGGYGRLKIIHEAVIPEQWMSALQRLPSIVTQVFIRRIQEWSLKSLMEFFTNQREQFIAAADNPAEGVTIVITISNPPGYGSIRQALRGRTVSFATLKMTGPTPPVKIQVVPGVFNE